MNVCGPEVPTEMQGHAGQGIEGQHPDATYTLDMFCEFACFGSGSHYTVLTSPEQAVLPRLASSSQ